MVLSEFLLSVVIPELEIEIEGDRFQNLICKTLTI